MNGVDQGSPGDPPKRTQVMAVALGCFSEAERKLPVAEDTLLVGHRTQIICTGPNPKASFLWSIFHGTRKYCASFGGRVGN